MGDGLGGSLYERAQARAAQVAEARRRIGKTKFGAPLVRRIYDLEEALKRNESIYEEEENQLRTRLAAAEKMLEEAVGAIEKGCLTICGHMYISTEDECRTCFIGTFLASLEANHD